MTSLAASHSEPGPVAGDDELGPLLREGAEFEDLQREAWRGAQSIR